jgi:hemerythrin superfamily protein
MGRIADPGQLSIFDILIREHRTVENLFGQIIALCQDEEGSDEQDLEELFALLATNLRAHADAEEAVLYERLATLDDLAEDMPKAREEHAVVEHLLDELEALSSDDGQWLAKLQVLQELVQHHVDEEEDEIFPAAREALDAAEASALGEDFLALVEQLTGEPPLEHLGMQLAEATGGDEAYAGR